MQGFLFDLDGTLINSERAVERCWKILATEMKLPLDSFVGMHGIPAIQTIQTVCPDMEFNEAMVWQRRLEELEIEDTEGVRIVPGVSEVFEELQRQGIPWLIVTSCTPDLAIARTRATGIVIPEGSVTFADVERGKPFPDPFLLGAKRLGFRPEECWAVEDAPAGVTSAKSAGCKVAAVLTSHSEDQLTHADVHVREFSQLLSVTQMGSIRP